MRLYLLLLTLFFLGLFNEINAQWTIKNLDETSGWNDNVIKFKSDSLGLFMGNNSIVLKSKDIGETWNIINLETQVNIKDFQFISDTIIYAVGDYYEGAGDNLTSKLIKSLDNGDTWDSITSFSGKQLYSLWFFNNDSGMVAGYDGVYRTIDSGYNWDTVWSITQFSYLFGDLQQIYFPTEQIGYAVGQGYKYKKNKSSVEFFVLKTYNSGLTWNTINTFPYFLASVHFLNQDTGYIGTETSSGIVLKTIDGGDTWNEVTIPIYYNSIKSIQFISNLIGFAVGAPTAFVDEGLRTSFFTAKTIDGGDTWESYDTIGIPLNSIYFLNDTLGFVSGSYSLIMKSNGKISGLPNNYPWNLAVGDVYLDEKELVNSLVEVFPNPTSGLLTIKLNNATQSIKTVKLVSFSGQVLKIIKPISNYELLQLDMTNVVSGIYLIQVTYLDKIESLKVVKK